MYLTEEEEYAFCAACDGEVSIVDRVYPFGHSDVLCFGCAVERQGVYQEVLERWTVSPKVDDLSEAGPLPGSGSSLTPSSRAREKQALRARWASMD